MGFPFAAVARELNGLRHRSTACDRSGPSPSSAVVEVDQQEDSGEETMTVRTGVKRKENVRVGGCVERTN